MQESISPSRKKELLLKAEKLSHRLYDSGVKRSEWQHVINALFHPAPGSETSLDVAQELLELLPSCGLEYRAGRTKEKLQLVCEVFRDLRRESWSREEWRFVIGWTSRHLSALDR